MYCQCTELVPSQNDGGRLELDSVIASTTYVCIFNVSQAKFVSLNSTVYFVLEPDTTMATSVSL